ncbi:MAG: VOC family protein [Planctomycetota bacterium]
MPELPLTAPDGPKRTRVNALVPMAHVVDVDRSAEFYALLGFTCASRFSDPTGKTNWCELVSGSARLFLARASGPIDAADQAVLFYLYAADVRALREHLLARGLTDAGPIPWEEGGDGGTAPERNAVFDIVPRFYMPDGELRVHDPDGYVLLVGQLGSA